MTRRDDGAARTDDGPAPGHLDPSEVPVELRNNPIVRQLVDASDEELLHLEEAAELDRDGLPPGTLDDER